MPTENLSTTDAPIRPGETLLGNPPPPSPNRSGDTLLIWCFVASLVICAILAFLLNYADLYGTQATSNQQHLMHLRVYRPPVKHKPKPKPKIIPPKPPKIIPKIVHVIPKIQPHPIPRVQPRPTPHTITTTAHSTQANAPVIAAAPTPPEQQAVPVTPSPEPAPPPTKPEPPPTPPAPVVKPTPPAPVVKYVPQPPPPAPKPVIPDRPVPELEASSGSFDNLQLPGGLDPSTLNSTTVNVTWEVDSHGNVRNIHFKPTGNSDVDQAIRSLIQGFKFKPAVIGGVAQPATLQHEFDLG